MLMTPIVDRFCRWFLIGLINQAKNVEGAYEISIGNNNNKTKYMVLTKVRTRTLERSPETLHWKR